MDVNIPMTFPPPRPARSRREKSAYAQELQRDGRWKNLWRVVGEYANYSLFDVESNDGCTPCCRSCRCSRS